MGWKTKKLSDVLDIQNGYAFDSKQFSSEEGMPLIRIRDISNGLKTVTNYAGEYKSIYVVRKGDFLIGMDGEFRCYEWKGEDALLNQRVCRLQNFSDELSAKFLSYGINKYLQDIEDVTGFTTVKHISASQIKNIEFPLPPIPEQQRIVAILDQAFADIEKARANAEKNLKNARELFDSYLNQVFSQRGEGWIEKEWGDLCSFVRGPFGGSLKKSMFKESGYTVFEQKHAIHDHIEQFRYFIDEDKFLEMKRFKVIPGEMIMSCSGVTLGRVSVIPDGAPQGIINQALLKLTPKDGTDIHFIKYWIRSPIFQEIIFKDSGGAAQPNVPAAKLLKVIKLSIPNIAHQHIVVNKIQSFLEINQELIKVYETKLKSLDELKKSLLQKAFAGELTKSKGITA